MENQITYLFGAGASYDALPIVYEIPYEMYRVSDSIRDLNFNNAKLELKNIKSDKESINLLSEKIRELADETRRHASIDTYAKKLFIKQEYSKLNELKILLSICFSYIQITGVQREDKERKTIYNKEKRYDSFFASILTNSASDLPKHVRILSWNYDQQFEYAYKDYLNPNIEFRDLGNHLRFLTKGLKFYASEYPINDFCIIKLNGSTGFFEGGYGTGQHYFTELTDRYEPLLDFYINKYKEVLKRNNEPNTRDEMGNKIQDGLPLLSFAWENEKKISSGSDGKYLSIIDQAKERTLKTSILVVIGYSFPYFNREIDQDIINNMQGLKKVYIQDPRAHDIIQRFKTIYTASEHSPPIEIVPITSTDQFLLPNEL